MEAYLAAEAGRRLAPLKALDDAMAAGQLKGLARGVAYRLREAGGALDRRAVAESVRQLSSHERRALKALGVRFAAFSVHVPGVLTEPARELSLAYLRDGWRPPLDRPSRLPEPLPTPAALGVRGLVAAGSFAVPVSALERLDTLLRAEPPVAGASVLTPDALAELGWEDGVARAVLKGLGFVSARKSAPGEPSLWRMRQDKPPAPKSIVTDPASPFAALSVLQPAPVRRRKPRRKPHPSTRSA